jgi:hypothetical protein
MDVERREYTKDEIYQMQHYLFIIKNVRGCTTG